MQVPLLNLPTGISSSTMMQMPEHMHLVLTGLEQTMEVLELIQQQRIQLLMEQHLLIQQQSPPQKTPTGPHFTSTTQQAAALGANALPRSKFFSRLAEFVG